MNLKCFFKGHKWSPWIDVRMHLESTCSRCKTVRVRYPSPRALLVDGAIVLALAYVKHKYGIEVQRQVRLC